ncbi:hypothetical protein HJG54_04550 [Leptolyngbya sp. NK1-12]|uniref:Plasmid segregation centromere-binding protein ParR n=1 Tax=Leptolyngbya sp. NK1-12 TaxID=2547451 RepID=A0AA96WBT6_9CYAN|nr:hypothetical protein [Leptolyngbya sp. NK1-12]WNZ22204.1 hypothetical protein HJG54_04550 [Leptolyngbya sp. NK1-12]
MTSSKPKSSYVVKFASTEADQDLLQAVEQALADQTYKSFSDLCKQALRLMLIPTETTVALPLLTALEQQVMTLQLQLMQLEQRSKEAQAAHAPAQNYTELQQQVEQLTERVSWLEQKCTTLEEPPTPASDAPDPLLSRLAPLLEDF